MNQQKSQISEAQLTAYALNETEGLEKEVIESYLSQNKDAQKFVSEIRETSAWVKTEMAQEPLPQMNVRVKTQAQTIPWYRRWTVMAPVMSVAFAATLVFVLVPRMQEETLVQTPPPTLQELDMEDVNQNQSLNAAKSKISTHGENKRADVGNNLPIKPGYMAVGQISGADSLTAPTEVLKEGIYGAGANPAKLAKKGLGGLRGEAPAYYVDGGPEGPNSESYQQESESEFLSAKDKPLSTFSIDVDTASYSNIRRFLNSQQKVPAAAVRIEEMINYFSYEYATPKNGKPFAVHIEQSEAPWATGHQIVKIGIKGRELETSTRPASRLVFLIDVSGSMQDSNKLPLVKESLKLLTESMTEKDQIAIVTYAGNSGVVLPPTSANNQAKIREALDRLTAGGATHGSAGIQSAYEQAQKMFLKEGNNRVIIASDGDFNVGTTSREDLQKLIVEKAKSGIFLSVLGFGMGNFKDSTMEMLANKGNGNYAYIDQMSEAKKVFIQDLTGTLFTIAKDVKIQVDFNPAFVREYRLIGYDNRRMANQDFADDTKDAGEIGAGHTVTAIYEVIPVGVAKGEVSKYQKTEVTQAAPSAGSGEMLTVNVRYKTPQGSKSELLEYPVVFRPGKIQDASADLKWAASVAEFGMILQNSKFKSQATIDQALELAEQSLKIKKDDYRQEYVELVKKAKTLGH